MTFVISAFQMYVLHFGHFFENRKNSGLTPGQNDDLVTRTWPKWPTDPVPCLAGMPSWTVTTSAIDLPTLGKMEEHCCSLRQSSLTCWGSPKKSTSTPRLRSCREFTESVCRLWRHFWLLWSLPASTAWRFGSGAVRAFSLLWQLRRHCRILGRACPICHTHPFTWCCVCMAKCTVSGQWVLHKE